MCQTKEGGDLSWLVNSPSARVRLVYHGLWIIAPPYPPQVKELILLCLVSYNSSSSTPQVHLLCLDPTIATFSSSPVSAPPPCTVHRQGGRPPSPIWSSVVSWCTPQWGGFLRFPLPPLPMGTPILCLPCIFLSTPWSVVLPGGGNPPRPWASPLSPPRSCYHII